MMMPTPVTNPLPRIVSVDAIRGFALCGIVIVHMLEQYVGGPVPDGALAVANSTLADQIITGVSSFLIRGKFFALFSILFGLSFFIQMDRAQQRGEAYSGRFLWRLVLLFGIGYIHSLIYRGDILTIYAIVGIFLIPFFRFPSPLLLGLIAILLAGAGRYLTYGLFGTDPLFVPGVMDSSHPDTVAYFTGISEGSILDVFRWNAGYGLATKAEFQMGIFGRIWLTFAYFLLGLWLGRIRFFDKKYSDRKELLRPFWYFLIATLVLAGLVALIFVSIQEEVQNQQFDSWLFMIGISLTDLINTSLTGMMILGFMLMFRTPGGKRFFSALAPYGRMALTNYVVQSLIGTFVFFGWGLGQIGHWHNWMIFLFALFILAAQVRLSQWWLTHYYYGPLEWAWRSLTYFKVQAFRRPEPV